VTARSRLQTLQDMVEARPEDPRALFGLALEYERMEDWERTVETLRTYLQRAEDEGNAFGRLGAALSRLGRTDEARKAYEEGIAVAYRHNHPTMAMEFEEALEELDP
jgi:Flp pilus assembly protein TadD